MSSGRLLFERSTATTAVLGEREVVSFAGCNYLGLAHHPAVIDALKRAVGEHGIGVAASRETSGNRRAHEQLEKDAARLLGTEAALLVPDGYLANLVIAQAIAPDHSLALVDAASHASIRDALSAVGLRTLEYSSAADATRIADAHRSDSIVVFTDGVFPSQRRLAPLPDLLEILERRAGVLIVDDCHGFGVLGPCGRGVLEHFGLSDRRIVITTTLSKAFGCQGGLIASTQERVERVRTRSRAYVGSTPIPPALACAASAALRVFESDPARLQRLRANAARLRETFLALGLPVSDFENPVFPFTLASPARMRSAHEALLSAGLLVPFIQYPGGPADFGSNRTFEHSGESAGETGGYLRLALTAEHTRAEIDRLAGELAKLVKR